MLASALLTATLGALASAQCINTIAKYHPTERTACYNSTIFLVPVDKSAAQSMTPYPLLPLPTDDKSYFPNGFPANQHIMLVSASLGHDIRQYDLEIDNLNAAAVYIPYVDRVKGSGVPFTYQAQGYIGNAGDQIDPALVPALVGSAEGNTLYEGHFDPETAAWADVGGNTLIRSVKQVIVPNPISGPGVVPTVIDMSFHTIASSQSAFTEKLFLRSLNQAVPLNNGVQCQYNLGFINETFADPTFRQGDVTLYNIDGTLKGYYQKQYGYSVAYEQVGLVATSCEDAAKAYPSVLKTF